MPIGTKVMGNTMKTHFQEIASKYISPSLKPKQEKIPTYHQRISPIQQTQPDPLDNPIALEFEGNKTFAKAVKDWGAHQVNA